MESILKTYPCPEGKHLRVQCVRLSSWEQLDFFRPQPSETALDCFAEIYRRYLVPGCPWIFGNMILFRLPQELQPLVPMADNACGKLIDPLTAAATYLKRQVTVRRGKPHFRSREAERFWQELAKSRCVHIVSGKLPQTTVIPVGETCGYLSQGEAAKLKVNASFFIMDRFDCATIFDRVGTTFGLTLRDGQILTPPLFSREALLVHKDGTVTVQPLDIRSLTVKIGSTLLRHGENAQFHSRPDATRVRGSKGQRIVIVGDRVEAVCTGAAPIPASGFVLEPLTPLTVTPGDKVSYLGLEDFSFGIQVGNSILKDGVVTDRFLSRFFNIRALEPVPFPPSLYPMNFEESRAARIALGADEAGRPMLLWAEGAPKLGYDPQVHSCGATLADMGRICRDCGMVNAINLDGGGSAQLLLEGQRQLQISDRDPKTLGEAERPIPLALIVR